MYAVLDVRFQWLQYKLKKYINKFKKWQAWITSQTDCPRQTTDLAELQGLSAARGELVQKLGVLCLHSP